MQSSSFNLHEILENLLLELRAAWRYRWYALIVAWCIMLVGAALVFSLPNKYEASAQVYADTEALTNPLLRGVAVQPDVRQRLRIITHTLLSRPNLEIVANKTGLSSRATTPAEMEDLLDNLGNAVKINDAGAKDLYNLTYDDPDRQVAKRVVQGFLQILMNDTLGQNNASTDSAQSFLQQQVNDYSQKLNDAESKLADFKKENIAYLPSQGGGNYFARLQEAETQLQTLQDQYETELATRATTLKQMRAMETDPSSGGVDPRTQQIDSQIASYQQKLNTLLLNYTEKYPDVVSTKRMISQLKARRDALKKSSPGSSSMGVVSDNSVYQEMQKSLYGMQVKIQSLATQINLQKQRISDLHSQAGRITGVQATLQKLSRNYETTKKQYDELLSHLNTAHLSQDATQSGNNLKFRVVNPPDASMRPVSPKRAVLLLVVFAMALGVGGGFAYFLHKINPVFVSLKGLREVSGYPVIGAIGLVVSRARQATRRKEVIGFCTGGGLLAVVLVIGIAFNAPLTHFVQHFFVLGPL
ncbi:XrtA system polysaccharide chain length determinant [Oleiagrimonas sp. C23AA]|uniref:XrtA system polysaccharide chain length determinant n=1 Tax=Oleiagrimonas sp. C23AA TaxID=2719047 RepID=UPI001422FD7D|nr:XrtA system polysaccharide chain length determinant [Oleiagrimonas sp. C23AA]NII11175.1 chain length-determining protein [Oleiagrimonas sp. C23AA]